MTRAVSCSTAKCGNLTNDPTGRCHHHRGAPVPTALTLDRVSFAPPKAVLSFSSVSSIEDDEWEPGTKHPTGGYREVVYDPAMDCFRYYSAGTILHREDGPAIEGKDGRLEWHIGGKKHREDGPAVVSSDGTETYYLNGVEHREDGPAVVSPFGGETWMRNGKRHREDGPAARVAIGGQWVEQWYREGRLYREDGPSVEGSPDYTTFSHPGTHSALKGVRTGKNFDALVRAGAERTEAVRWLFVEGVKNSEKIELVKHGVRATDVEKLVEQGVTTPEGWREVLLEGAPVEWVRSYEKASR